MCWVTSSGNGLALWTPFLNREQVIFMTKTLCEMKKMLKSDFGLYRQFVCQATHLCTKCGRAANDKKLLCRPEKLKD